MLPRGTTSTNKEEDTQRIRVTSHGVRQRDVGTEEGSHGTTVSRTAQNGAHHARHYPT